MLQYTIKELFLSSQYPDRLWNSPVLLYSGYRGSFPEIQRQGNEIDHTLPTSANVNNNGGAVPPFPVLHGVVLN
jgi:hypothetical protein